MSAWGLRQVEAAQTCTALAGVSPRLVVCVCMEGLKAKDCSKARNVPGETPLSARSWNSKRITK